MVLGCVVGVKLASAQLPDVDYQWVEKKNQNGIRIFTSVVPGSKFKAVRGEMKTQASVASLVALVQDLSACPKWVELCRESRLLERLTPHRSRVHVINDLPFPVRDREVLVHMEWHKDPASGRISMVSRAAQGDLPSSSAVRITEAVSQWHFTPLEGGGSKVESFAHVNPNGAIPAWLTNLLLVNSPHSTMSNMRDVAQTAPYNESRPLLLDQF